MLPIQLIKKCYLLVFRAKLFFLFLNLRREEGTLSVFTSQRRTGREVHNDVQLQRMKHKSLAKIPEVSSEETRTFPCTRATSSFNSEYRGELCANIIPSRRSLSRASFWNWEEGLSVFQHSQVMMKMEQESDTLSVSVCDSPTGRHLTNCTLRPWRNVDLDLLTLQLLPLQIHFRALVRKILNKPRDFTCL